MALTRLFLKPGIDKQNTEYGAEGGWTDSDYVRFRYGLPEKMGGWESYGDFPTYFVGLVSMIYSWNSLNGTPYLMIGTTKKLYASTGGTWADVTPIRKQSTGVTFTSQAGSDIVIVNDPVHNAIDGDFVTYSSVTGDPCGYLNTDFEHEFEIQQVLNPNQYTILMPSPAPSTAIADGDGSAAYQISVGPDVSFFDFGWGVGTWGYSTWGTPRPAAAGGLALDSRVWQFDSYGEDVVCQLVDGSTYYFDTSLGISNRATVVAGAPTKSKFALVSTPDRHLVCFGTETVVGDSTSQDPMFVRFSNQEDISSFSETATNTAGGQRLTDGSQIVSAIRSRGQILIFTDTSLHGMQYVGPPYTFGFQQLGINCGCIGPHAAVDVNGVALWMGRDAFYIFDGTVKKLPCTVQDYVFKNIDVTQGTKTHVGLNSEFSEVTWWYCSADSSYIDRFVTYNYLENTWHTGSMPRTAWTDAGAYPRPLAAQYLPTSENATISTIFGLSAGRSTLFSQETGVNADGQPIESYIESGYFDIGDGDNIMFMSRFIPDFKEQVGNLVINIHLRAYPSSTATLSSLDPYPVTPTTEKVDTRARGRQIALRITGDELDSHWRFGTFRVDLQPDGLR